MRLAALTFTFVLALLFCAAPSHAQRIELYGSYSYVRAPVTFFEPILCPIPGCPAGFNTHTLNFNGYSVGGAFKLLGPLAIKADFSDTSNSFQGADTHLKTYLFGPQLRFPGPVSPFAHFLVGGAHESTNTGSGSLLFAPAFSGGW